MRIYQFLAVIAVAGLAAASERRLRQTTSCTVADDCTCTGAHEVASCDNNLCHCHHDGHHNNEGNHHPPHHPRAVFCNNNADCSAHCDPHNGNCINNACHCSHHRRQAAQCTAAADCTCADNQIATCPHGHCVCHHDHDHHPRALCHNGHQCTCPTGHNGVCNDQGHCECGDHGQVAQCTTAADCTCADNQVADCPHGHCVCYHDHHQP
uniref:Uncharacterized protein n=1 Tax=Magallana gigas TaxID=29159 RepID=K1QBD9_MAGGI